MGGNSRRSCDAVRRTGERDRRRAPDPESNALEASNVNLTMELVELIKAQSNFQANSKTISTESTIMQTIIQMT